MMPWPKYKRLLPIKDFWTPMSAYSLAYAEAKGAGKDVNSAKSEKERHSSFKGKDSPRIFKRACEAVAIIKQQWISYGQEDNTLKID